MSDDERLPAPRASALSLEVFASIVDEGVKAVAVQTGIDEFTAAGLGAGAGALLKSFPDALREAWLRRSERAAEADDEAERTSGYRYEALLLEALKDDRKLWLLRNAYATAMSEDDRRRVRFYGRIAASGVLAQDRATVDTAARVFSAIAALDPADLKVLLRMGTEGWIVRPPRKAESTAHRPILTQEMPELEAVMDAIVPRLEGVGLIAQPQGEGLSFGLDPYHRTAFGEACVQALLRGEEAGEP